MIDFISNGTDSSVELVSNSVLEVVTGSVDEIILSSSSKIEIAPPRVVDVLTIGLQGPPGPRGLSGEGTLSISTDLNNRLTQGTDSGLFVQNDLTTDPLAYYILSKA